MNTEDKIRQNKPSWGDAPEWANWLGQTSSGSWEFYEYQPSLGTHCWHHEPGLGICKSGGEVIGDWRDTLEPRPKTTYLPEINEECEYSLGGFGSQNYFPCTICYRYTDYRGEHFIIECPHLVSKQHVSVESEVQPVFFRPSGKKAWVEKARELGFKWGPAERMYDAMQSGELPVPEVK